LRGHRGATAKKEEYVEAVIELKNRAESRKDKGKTPF